MNYELINMNYIVFRVIFVLSIFYLFVFISNTNIYEFKVVNLS